MSVEYCHNCGKYIDTDFNAEHFEECQECTLSPDCGCDDCQNYEGDWADR